MTWLRTDDGFPEHPKCDVLARHFGDDWAVLNLAFALWHHMGCDCAARRTDGAFDAARAYRVMRAPREAVDKALAGLVKARLLERKRDGFLFHDWAEYQPTKAQLDAERAQKTARQARWRAGKPEKAGAAEAPRETVGSARVDGGVDASTSRLGDGGVEGAPSRPVPSRPKEEGDTRPPAREEPSPAVPPKVAARPPAPVPPTRRPPPTPRDTPWLDALNRAAQSYTILAGVPKLEADLDDLLARHNPSDEVIAAMGAAFADASKWWPGQRPKNKRLTINDLAGFDPGGGAQWKPLAALVAHAQDVVERAGRGARRPDDLPPPPPPVDPATLPPPLTPEQVVAARPAFFRNRPTAPTGAPDAK